ncbi:ATP binding, partial [Coemansia nantahalensis]
MRSSAAWPQSLARLSTGLDDAAAGTGEARYTLQQVMQWSEQRVCQWVQEQGFAKYAGAFREQQVNGEALVELDYGLLKELSVRTVGERVRLNLAIRRLRQQCLQTDARNASHGRSSRSATLDSVSGPSAFAVHAGADTVASPGPLSAASMGTAAGAEPSTAGTFGLVSALPGSAGSRKELPILPRASMSFNSIGLSDIGESVSGSGGGGGGGAGSARPNGNSSVLHRANTDTHTFGARDQRAPDHTSVLASATVRKPKTATAPGQPHRLPNPLLSTPPHKPAAVQPLVPLSAPVPRQRAPLAVASQPSLRRGPHRTTKAVSPAPVLSSAAGSSASV